MEKISKDLKKHLYVCILSGGGGKRLWPRSRKETPKQFIDLFGDSTVFEKTLKRSRRITTSEKIFVVTSCRYVAEVLTQGRDLLLRNIVAEPMAKNTALAMAMGAAYIYRQDPEAVIINLTSDHIVSPGKIFRRDMILAAEVAAGTGRIVTVGIKPDYPHSGFGYIKVGKEESLLQRKKVYHVERFTEKPSLSLAKKFIKEGDYYWNAGLYIWKAKVLMESLARFAPKVAGLIERARAVMGRANEAAVIRQIYEEAEDISIDYAVSEKADNLLLLPASFSWDDIGDWEVVYRRSKKDKEGNAVIKYGQRGGYVVFEAKNNLIHFNNTLLALVGVNDLIVVDTGDALLIAHRSQAEKVKQVVKKIEEEGKLEYL